MMLSHGPDIGVEIVTKSSETVINQIIDLGKATYPISSNGDKHSFYSDDLNNRNCINLVLKREGRIVGYLLAYPHNEARVESEELGLFYGQEQFNVLHRYGSDHAGRKKLGRVFDPPVQTV